MAPGPSVPAAEIDRRRHCIQAALQQKGIDGLFIVQRVDLYYFSGTAQSGFLYMPAEGDPLLFVRRYAPRARRESPIRQLFPIDSVKAVPGLIREALGCLPGVVGFELDVMPVREFRFFRALFPAAEHVDAAPLILNCRMLKSAWEIARIEETADVSARTFRYMQSVISTGMTEIAFAAAFEAYARQRGHGGGLRVRDYRTEGYPWHVLSGPSGGMVGLLDSPASGEGTSAAFPCGAGPRPLQAHEPIMVDFGSVCNGYHMDETRMFAIRSMPEPAYSASRAAIAIHDRVLDRVRPGVRMAELFDCATAAAEACGEAQNFLGPPGHKVNFIGHGVGLELVEPPFIARGHSQRLQPGMTIALEPKIVYKDQFSAGIESVFQVTVSGARLISKTPVDIFVC
jgi:Xaa-Pro aminopeptidase